VTSRLIQEYKRRPQYRIETEEAERILASMGINVHSYGMQDANSLLDHWHQCISELQESANESGCVMGNSAKERMGYGRIRSLLTDFDASMGALKFKINDSSAIKASFDSVREFLADREGMAEPEWRAKWKLRFAEYWVSQYVVRVLAEAVGLLKDRVKPLRDTLKIVCEGSLDPDNELQTAQDAFYGLEVAVLCKEAGFEVSLREPDLVIEGGGLTQPLAIACKYPSSRKQVYARISKGYRQIAKQELAGVVCVGLDLIVFDEMGLKAFVDFRKCGRHPLAHLADQLTTEMRKLLVERTRDYPDERPFDRLLLTLKPYGIFGNPAQLTLMHSVTLHCCPNDPYISDLGILCSRLRAIEQHDRSVV
jgi:hypothetical protein